LRPAIQGAIAKGITEVLPPFNGGLHCGAFADPLSALEL